MRHLVWLDNNSRPDVLNAVRAVARYPHAPEEVNWLAVLHVSTLLVALCSSLGMLSSVVLVLNWDCVDWDFAIRATDRRTVYGALERRVEWYRLFLGRSGVSHSFGRVCCHGRGDQEGHV